MNVGTKGRLLLASSTAALFFCVQAPSADAGSVKVASIYGIYDAECGSNIVCNNTNPLFSGATSFGSNSVPGGGYDTPALFIYNQSGEDMSNVQMTLSGYQDRNLGVTKMISLPDIAAGEVYELYWNDGYGGTVAGDLFSYDYDDEYGSTAHTSHGAKLPACDAQPYNICARVGNFDVLLTASTGSNPHNTANFSPDNTQGGGNQQGTFVGWEGLDPSGISETVYDDHSSTVQGVLAYMYTGTKGSQTAVPEPATLALTGAGMAALAFARRRRKKAT